MPNTWDRPPFPKKGNLSQRVLFASLGAAINAWEEVEIALAHLHSVFVTGDRFNEPAMHYYGEPSNFVARVKRLEEAAETHFRRNCDQAIEGEYCD